MLRASGKGIFLVWYVLICAWVTDTFAYLGGKVFNTRKHKFSKISPNKSIEGCISGAMRSSDCCCYLYNYM